MLVLFESAAGYGLFSLNDGSKLKQIDNLQQIFQNVDQTKKMVTLKKFSKFKNTADALKATTKLVEGKLSSSLKKFLRKEVLDKGLQDAVAISDPKLAGVIKDKLGIQCVHDNTTLEIMRGIRGQLENLVTELSTGDLSAMSLGLSHSLSRYKLKFSPDKVDTMIVQAISLLDDLDKELNTYAMRVREWYGWHFPELSRVIPDNILYAKLVNHMGVRSNALHTDFSDILPEQMGQEVKDAAQISMGTEVSEEDIENVKALCTQVINISEYREQLFEYLKNRMQAIAPNLTVLVGELVGARLIAHAGSLLNLAKHPASTVQILGAEKALFRALKTKRETPKYGLIYHASIVGQTPPKFKGKISRVIAAKAALATRYDALGEGEHDSSMGIEARTKVEERLKSLESGQTHRLSGTAKGKKQPEKYDSKRTAQNIQKGGNSYNAQADTTINGDKKKRKIEENSAPVEEAAPEKRKHKKNKE